MTEAKKIPTAADFFTKSSNSNYTEHEWRIKQGIEFAKFHVQAALLKAANDWMADSDAPSYNKDTIINAYPLTKIQ